MSYHHYSIEERCCLREYYKKGYSYRKIAKLLGRNVSSVSRELRRNCTHMYDIPTYYPHTAQKKSNLRRSYCHRGMFWSQELIAYIEEKLLATWSPEQIANAPSPFEKMPSARTIYRWIYENKLPVYRENWAEIREILADSPTPEQVLEMLESVGLYMSEFEKMYAKEKRIDGVRYAKDLKDRYTVLWMYEQVEHGF